jgi:putative DNA methylase
MRMTRERNVRLIESDDFAFEFLSRLAERESWRKELHRPIYHVHKWWANRLGSIFRGIILGSTLPADADLPTEFYRTHALTDLTVFDPFMGSGTTVGEAHKLGCTALGRDINPVAAESVASALGPMDRRRVQSAFDDLSEGVGKRIRELYQSRDSRGGPCEVLYYFWVMQVRCPDCSENTDLFSSFVVARNAAPRRKHEVQVLCPECGDIFPGSAAAEVAACPECGHEFDAFDGPARGAKAACRHCNSTFTVIDAVAKMCRRPDFRLYGKLVLTKGGNKEYLPVSADDHQAFQESSATLREQEAGGLIQLPALQLEHGYNTRQAMNYKFCSWRDFFNDRQLLALGWLKQGIEQIDDAATRRVMATLFSGVLEFNNLFASYKGEGTGAVRHMFSHHILKPERMPIEANVWGTRKSSGSFLNLFQSRLLRAIDYREAPTEVNGKTGQSRVCAPPFSGEIEPGWPVDGHLAPRGIYVSCGDSAQTALADQSVDLVVTDPPFFDNVHYSELADFFFAWQQLAPDRRQERTGTTRSPAEVQDSDAGRFSQKLQGVFAECHRVLKDDGLLVFTYHHSRDEGWTSLAESILGAGFAVVNSQPVKAEMSVATPKFQAKEPIQLDIILVCRKQSSLSPRRRETIPHAIAAAHAKLARLEAAGFSLSRNDRKIVLYGQLLTTTADPSDTAAFANLVETELDLVRMRPAARRGDSEQMLLFREA